jgi:cytochrome P450
MHKETMKMALHVITAAGYGYPFDWEDENTHRPRGHSMSFRESIGVTVDNLITLIALPSWVLRLPIQHLRNVNQASKELRKYLHNIIDLGRNHDVKLSGNTVISQLIAHSDMSEELKDRSLNDDEIMGNSFIFLTAGYETV